MANVRPATPTRNAMLNAVRDLVDAGAGVGVIYFMAGTQPADGDGADGTILGSAGMSDPCAAAAANGLSTYDTTPVWEDVSADAAGNITWARIKDSAGNKVFDCDVTVTGGGGTIQVSSVNVSIGDIIRITSFTLGAPAG